MKIFMLSTSLNSNSINKKLIKFSAELLKNLGHKIDIGEFSDFNAPLYNVDLEKEEGLPEPVKNFIRKIISVDCIIFSCPEYNYSISGVFKNLIDWVSRAMPNQWKGKKILLMSASPASAGGNRGLWATRIPLEGLGAYVFPTMFSLAESYKTIDTNGQITNPDILRNLNTILEDFLEFSSFLTPTA